jgi:hypothetical protein
MRRQISRKFILFSQEKVFGAWRELVNEFLIDWMLDDVLWREVDNTSGRIGIFFGCGLIISEFCGGFEGV